MTLEAVKKNMRCCSAIHTGLTAEMALEQSANKLIGRLGGKWMVELRCCRTVARPKNMRLHLDMFM